MDSWEELRVGDVMTAGVGSLDPNDRLSIADTVCGSGGFVTCL